jgi:hypothetical protein
MPMMAPWSIGKMVAVRVGGWLPSKGDHARRSIRSNKMQGATGDNVPLRFLGIKNEILATR